MKPTQEEDTTHSSSSLEVTATMEDANDAVAAATERIAKATLAMQQTNTVSENNEEEEKKECDVLQKKQHSVVSLSNTYTTSDDPHLVQTIDNYNWSALTKGHDDDHDPHELPPRYPREVDHWSPLDTDICLVGTTGQKITKLGTDFVDPKYTNFRQLTALALRSHCIKDMAGLGKLTGLELLELYDNMVEALDEDSLKGMGATLRVLDMSYNAIRSMAPVQHCSGSALTELFLASNKLKTIEGISHLRNLRKLDLGANRIRRLPPQEFAGLHNLEELWLGKNKIESLAGIESLTKLIRLDVQSNRLTSLCNEETGVCHLNHQRTSLEELYLAHNGLDDEALRGLISCRGRGTTTNINFPSLTTLDLSRNRLTSAASLVEAVAAEDSSSSNDNSNFVADWPELDELWLSGNDIQTFEALVPLRDASKENRLPKLETIYLEYNPISRDYEYRKKLAEFLPTLQQIDAERIHNHGRVIPLSCGTGGKIVMTTESELRQLQEAAIRRAREQQQQQQQQQQAVVAAATPSAVVS